MLRQNDLNPQRLPGKVPTMAVSVELATVIHGEDGGHVITLPCCGETVYVRPKEHARICRSCHREIVDTEDLASADPAICVSCYTA
jgi:hypothetical protein